MYNKDLFEKYINLILHCTSSYLYFFEKLNKKIIYWIFRNVMNMNNQNAVI